MMKSKGQNKNLALSRSTAEIKINEPGPHHINFVNDNSIENPSPAEETFIQVEKKRKHKKADRSIIGSGKGPKIGIEAAPRFSFVHVCRLHPTLGEDILVEHLKANGFSDVTCLKLESRRPEEYSSFKVGVPTRDFEALKNPEIWPEGSKINNFLLHLSQRKKNT